MNILASVGRGLGSWLGLPSRNSLGLSAATASLPLREAHLPGSRPVTLIAAPAKPVAPVADAGAGLARGNPPDLDQHIRAIGGMSVKDFMAATSQVRAQASRGTAARPGASRPAPRAKAAPAPALEDDNQTVNPTPPADDPENPPGVDSIISQLLDLVLELKKQVQVTADDDEEVQGALALFAAKKKLSASSALMAVTKKMCERPKLTPSARIARGFNAQSGVQAIQAALRSGPRPAPAPVSTPAVSAPPIPSLNDRRASVTALRAERAALETSMQKSGRYDNKSIARQQQITAELKRLGAR
jgi:hypothetical protein